ncbi:MAG: nuclear transport factor 2 family protein [Alphaproteobacteria bacterium]|nr:nuclear transport factor 2 family protein [Alphaproteobacteria bacterium]
MGDEEKILFANDAFYAAFARADMSAMAEIWAHRHSVSVIHPGGDVVQGRAAVLDSWRTILDPVDAFDIEMRAPQARDHKGLGLVVCYEQVGPHALIASNLFAREDDVWRIVHHQSGPSPVMPDADAVPGAPVH